MRLIGTLLDEKEAFIFHAFLLTQGIKSTYEKQEKIRIWIYDEDQVSLAKQYLAEYLANPQDSKFNRVPLPIQPPSPPESMDQSRLDSPPPKAPSLKRGRGSPFTALLIALCAFLFLGNVFQQDQIGKRDGKIAVALGEWTPIQQWLMFDYSKKAQALDALFQTQFLLPYKTIEEIPQEKIGKFISVESIPSWNGVFQYWFGKKMGRVHPWDELQLFEKIREGEIWRAFTPCLLHGGWLHILFNMAWVWLLLRQVEERLPIWKVVFFILIVGSISNVAQYLANGPNFLGFSGVITGLVGFIWVRQRKAPWEGYPLQAGTIRFICIFVAAMVALELFSVIRQMVAGRVIPFFVANTAHVIGGIVGLFLGYFPFFARRSR